MGLQHIKIKTIELSFFDQRIFRFFIGPVITNISIIYFTLPFGTKIPIPIVVDTSITTFIHSCLLLERMAVFIIKMKGLVYCLLPNL